MEAMINAYKMLVGKPVRKRPRGRPKCGWEGNSRTDLRDIGFEDVE
jgi:hypothetical protein